jgi:hypothetical protein
MNLRALLLPVLGLLVAVSLATAATAPNQLTTTTNSNFYPLWRPTPPNTTDLVLIYQGGRQRSGWSPAELAPYVTCRDSRDGKEKWLFDGFLFIEYVNGKKHAFMEGLNLPAGDKEDWLDLLARNFEPGHGLAALEQVCAAAEQRLGQPLRRRQVLLTLPEPIEGATNWGELDGRKLDFARSADRLAACEWHLDNALRKWHELAPKHLVLAGFYFVPERTLKANPQFLPLLAQQVHQRGQRFFWIPYWSARGAAEWKEHGFDVAWQQPNHFFHPEVPDSRLEQACEFARQHGMGMEFEMDERLISKPETFRPRFDAYLNAFEQARAKTSASIAYYEGGGALLHLAQSQDPEVRRNYERLARWVLERQHEADRLASMSPAPSRQAKPSPPK